MERRSSETTKRKTRTKKTSPKRTTGKRRTTMMNFEQYASEGNEFINEVCSQLNTDNRNKAARITKAVFHAVRDRIPSDEAIHFSQQLPMALKGVFFDQYDPSRTPVKLRSKEAFLNYLAQKDQMAAVEDFPTEKEASLGLRAVFRVLENHLSKGQVDQVKALIPADIMELIDPEFQYPSISKNNQNMNRNFSRTQGTSRFNRFNRQDEPGYDERGYGQGTSYGRGYQSTGGYSSDYYGRGYEPRGMSGRGYEESRERDEPGWFERAGDRIREGWQNLRERFDDDDDRSYYGSSRYGRGSDDRNMFERAGDRIRESWNDLRGRDDDYNTDYRRHTSDYGTHYGDESYGRGTTGTGWTTSGRGYDRDMDMPDYRSRYGRNYPSERGHRNY